MKASIKVHKISIWCKWPQLWPGFANALLQQATGKNCSDKYRRR